MIKNHLTNISNNGFADSCPICRRNTKKIIGYERSFLKCINCEFIFVPKILVPNTNPGMGMEGSWSGPGGGGFREYYLVKLLKEMLNFKTFLLYGTGNTETFGKLNDERIDVTGCDVSEDVVEFKKQKYGNSAFLLPEELGSKKKYDGIIAVEVFEHFFEPIIAFEKMENVRTDWGIICGTTNFYPGGGIEDGNNPGYMSHNVHVAYWSNKSMQHLAQNYGLTVTAFEMECPGSVKPDEKYGQLWPNKRVFFIYEERKYSKFFTKLKCKLPILPIDKP